MQPLELYIHIPFCVKKCAYCDFLSGPAGEKEKEEYVKMLVDEIRNCPDTVQNYRVISIFFGGGTPSLLTGEQIGRLMDTVREIFTLDEDAEITMEMNPGTVTEEKLRKYRQAGVNRLSIGLQSVNDEELRLLGRIHTYEEFREAYHLARANGFSNINVDLISAIPGQTVESWRRTLEQVMALSPEHISAYSLILEEGTTFYKKYVEDEAKEGCSCRNVHTPLADPGSCSDSFFLPASCIFQSDPLEPEMPHQFQIPDTEFSPNIPGYAGRHIPP